MKVLYKINSIASSFVTLVTAIGIVAYWFLQGRGLNISIGGIFIFSISSLATSILLFKGAKIGVYLYILFVLFTCCALFISWMLGGAHLWHAAVMFYIGSVSVGMHLVSCDLRDEEEA